MLISDGLLNGKIENKGIEQVKQFKCQKIMEEQKYNNRLQFALNMQTFNKQYLQQT